VKSCVSKLCLLVLVISALPAHAARYALSGELSGRESGFNFDHRTLATQRFELGLLQKADFSETWKGALGLSAWDDSAQLQFADSTSSARPPAETRAEDRSESAEIRLRDAYLQYQSTHFSLRMGNQQVVWGEAFGFFFSDFINPKDLRDGLLGDLSKIRLQTPMLNGKLIFSDFALQAIFIPQPFFNINPVPGSAFSFPFKKYVPVSEVQIERELKLPMREGNEEYGGRLTYLLSGWDFSAFYFNYFDRNPVYAVDLASSLPNLLTLKENHQRVHTYGMTFTKDLDGFLMRFEGLMTEGRFFNYIDGPGLFQAQHGNSTYVVGFDLPSWRKLAISVQWSQDRVAGAPTGLLRQATQSLASLRLQRTTIRTQTAELIYIYSPGDGGHRGSLEYVMPISGRVENRTGIELMGGPSESEFGRLREASRVYDTLKCFF
jgi:hypothetical protein